MNHILRSGRLYLFLFLTVWPFCVASGSFRQDVMLDRSETKMKPHSRQKSMLYKELLKKATRVDNYKILVAEEGYKVAYYDNDSGEILSNAKSEQRRRNDSLSATTNNKKRQLDEYGNYKYYYYRYNDDDDASHYKNQDDYFLNENNYMSFNGFSLKYAKCQPVQRFSQNAVEAGEYSPMIMNDIVIVRLCPSEYCDDNRAYGCYSDFVDYAIEMTDYIRIMLRYKMDQNEQLCDWCESCNGRNRQLYNNYYYSYNSNNGDDGYNDDFNDDGNGDDGRNNRNSYSYSYAGAYVYDDDCDDYDAYCVDAYNNAICNDDNIDDNQYNDMAAEDYLDIIDCTQIDGGYFIRPRCDAYSETISMGLYNDRFCSSYAGNDIDITSFNLGLNQTYFEEFGLSSGCLDCSESDSPPYLNATANLCNRIDLESARCTSSLSSDLYGQNYTDSDNDCSFIESIRSGTYEVDGQLHVDSMFGVNSLRIVTQNQKLILLVTLLVCLLLAIYACYLHHSITTTLIKSLAHSDLIPPSKYHRRRSRSRSASRSHRSKHHAMVDKNIVEDESFAMKCEGSLA